MVALHVRKGFNLKVAGKPDQALHRLDTPRQVAATPAKLPFVKPRLLVKEGTSVKLGAVLYEDKRSPEVKFCSPGGGRVAQINFGPRRVIEQIVIELDDETHPQPFESFSEDDIEKINRAQLVQALMEGGLWPLIRQLPFRDYAQPDHLPPSLFVGLGSLEPFQPRAEVYLAGREELFAYGLTVLRKLSAATLYVCAAHADTTLRHTLSRWVNLTFTGPYPAHDAGVLAYHLKTTPADNQAWFIDGQDVLLLAHLLKKGRYPTERTVVLGGSCSNQPAHFLTRLGAPLAHISDGKVQGNGVRHICGGILTGYTGHGRGFMGLLQQALNLLPEGHRAGELLGLFRPGYRKPTYSRAFLSALNKAPLESDCGMHGGDRACIACGYCAQVCPVDILPQFAYKAILAGEVEEALAHGLLDCVECGLCAYVCPSKIELMETLKSAKSDFYREQAKQ